MRTLVLILLCLSIWGCSKKTFDEHVAAARQYAQDNDTTAAIVELKNAIQLAPESAEIRFELGRLYFQNEQFESAEKELSRAQELGYDSAKVIPLLAEAYKKTGALVAAVTVDHAESGLSAAEQLKVGYFKIDALVKLDKLENALLLAEELQQLESASYYKQLVNAYADILHQDFAGALKIIEGTREVEPYAEDVLKLQARILLQLERPSEAADVYLEYIKIHSRDIQTKFVVAKLLVDLNRMLEAEPIIDELLLLSSEHSLLNQMKSLVSASENDFETAQEHAEIAIQQGAADPVARLIAGYSAYQLQNFADANRHLSFIATSLPDNHPGIRVLAAAQLQLGMTDDVTDLLGRVEQINPQDAALFSRTSYELLSAGRIKQAKKMVARTATISESAEDLARLGVLKLSLNNVEGLLNLEQAVKKAPEYTPAHTTLATAYVFNGEFEKAEQLAANWLQREPDNAEAHLLLGNILLKQNKFGAARTSIEGALNLDPDFLPARMALINNFYQQGNNQEANAELDELLQQAPTYVPALAAHYLFEQERGFDSAAGPILKASELEPENVELKLLLARIYASNRDFKNALAILNGIQVSEQTPKAYWPTRGQTLLLDAQVKQAEAHYADWLKLDKYNKDAVLGTLLVMDSQSKFVEALALTEDFLEQRDDLQMQVLKTHFLLMNRRFDEAKVLYTGFSEQLKQMPFVRGMQARLQIFAEDFPAALPNAMAAYEANKNLRNMLMALFVLEKLGQHQTAMDTLNAFVTNNPNQVAAKMVLAERQIGKDVQSAMATYENILELNPDNFVVLNNLAFLKKQQGDLAQARKLAEKAVDIQPNSVEALDTLAQVLVAEEELDNALKYYKRIDIDKLQNEEIFLNYLEALLASDQIRLAQRQLEDRQFTRQDSKQRLSQLKQKYQL